MELVVARSYLFPKMDCYESANPRRSAVSYTSGSRYWCPWWSRERLWDSETNIVAS